MINKLVLSLLSVILLSACSHRKFKTQQEVWDFVRNEDNNLTQKKQVNGIEYTFTYKPTDLLILQELGQNKPSEIALQNIRNKYDDHVYFDLSMSKNGRELLTNVVGSSRQFGSLVNKLAFGLEEQVYLYTEKRDTIPLLDHIYPRMYGITKKTSVLLVYPREEIQNSESLTLVVNDLGFNTGEVKLKIPYQSILQEPTIDFAGL